MLNLLGFVCFCSYWLTTVDSGSTALQFIVWMMKWIKLTLQKLFPCLQTFIIRYFIFGLFHLWDFLTFFSRVTLCSFDLSISDSISQLLLGDVNVNLFITDYCMRGMTGYDLLQMIKVSYKAWHQYNDFGFSKPVHYCG